MGVDCIKENKDICLVWNLWWDLEIIFVMDFLFNDDWIWVFMVGMVLWLFVYFDLVICVFVERVGEVYWIGI